jgi:hypothetical protein
MADTLDKFIESRIIAMIEDHELIKRAMQQNFVALSQQNLGFTLRCGQKLEAQAVEKNLTETLKTAQNLNNIAPIDITKLKI